MITCTMLQSGDRQIMMMIALLMTVRLMMAVSQRNHIMPALMTVATVS